MHTEAEGATWPEAAAARDAGRPVVLPFGALEQHGPHLPLATDTWMAGALAQAIAEAVEGWLLPAIPLGHTVGNDGFPGTVSLSFDSVRAVASDVARSLQRGGWRTLVIVNGDYGNQGPLRAMARDAWDQLGFPVLVVDYPGLVEAAEAVCDTAPAGPGFYHADEFETSVLLALRPRSVRMDRAAPEYPPMPATVGSTPIGLHELSRSGVFGDPTAATAEKGRRLLGQLVDAAVNLTNSFLAERVGPITGS
jgi:creatinine amidohydrolase